jgi:hypothetical protein
MKKVVLSAVVMATVMLVSCGGPSAEELAKKAQMTADSIAQVEMQKHMEDSLAMVAEAAKAGEAAMADSLMKVAEQAKLDSIAHAAAGAKHVAVKKVVKKEVVKGTNGRDNDQKLNKNVKGTNGRDGDQKLNTTVKGTQGRG